MVGLFSSNVCDKLKPQMGPEKHAPIELQSEGDFLLFHLHAGLLKHQDVEREGASGERERERMRVPRNRTQQDCRLLCREDSRL